jgi:DNA invertase Pin-like site-specific DNA recombinase
LIIPLTCRTIEDPQRNIARRAERESGWVITHEYVDRARSGADNQRPQYFRMQADAKAGLFDVLIVDDLSRPALS